jgi:polysaccharide pyruvyl transferase WcaK-like protein
MRGEKVLVVGYHGMGNVGAELRLDVLIKDIKKSKPDADITIATFGYHNMEIIKGVKYLNLKNTFTAVFETILQIPKFDYVVCGEGIPFVDFCGAGFIDFFIPILRFAHLFGKKTACYAFDIDSMNSKHVRRAVSVLKKVDMLMVRSKESKKTLNKYGLRENVFLGTDSSFLFDMGKKSRKKNTIGFCLKDFYCYPIKPKFVGKKEDLYHYPHYYTYANGGRKKYEIFVERFADMINMIMEEDKKLGVRFIVMEHQMDYKVTKDVYDRLNYKKRAEIISHNEKSIKHLVSKFSEMKCLVSARYHAVLLGIRAKVPTLVLSTDERFDYFMEELGLKRFLIDVYKEGVGVPKIKGFVDEEKRRNSFSKKLAKELPQLERRANKNYKFLEKFFEK